MTPPDRRPKLIHVRRPVKRVDLHSEPLDEPATDHSLTRVGRSLKRVIPNAGPATYLELKLALPPKMDPDTTAAVLVKLTQLVESLNVYEVDLGGAGFWVDVARSGARPGPAVGLVLVPNDPGVTRKRLEKFARLLAEAAKGYAGKNGVLIQVMSAAEPDRPLFQVAA